MQQLRLLRRQVKVRRRGSDTKFVATVLAIGTECDIAMLTVKDDTFWQGVEPVRFGTLPHLQDSILVIGWGIAVWIYCCTHTSVSPA